MKLTRRRTIAFALAALVGLALVAEIGIRLICWATEYRPFAVATPWFLGDEDLMYTVKPRYEGEFFATTATINSKGLRGDDFASIKPMGTWRILCLGDSRTFGYYAAQNECYPARIAALWRRKFPDQPLEVLNAGRPGYTLYQGLRYLETEGLRYEPDVVTAAFGFNERRFVLRREQADGPERFRRVAAGLQWQERVRFSYALLGFAKVLRRLRGTDTWREDVLDLPSQRLDRLHCRVDLGRFRENVRDLAEVCRKRGIALVFLLMSDSPTVAKTFRTGMQLRARQHFDEAIDCFSRLTGTEVDEDTRLWFQALALYEIGLTYEAKGLTDKADKSFRQSAQAAAFWSVLGGAPIRHGREYVEMTRAVAGAFRAPCLDVSTFLADDPQSYADYCHFTARGHALIAENLLTCLLENRLIGALPEHGWTAPRQTRSPAEPPPPETTGPTTLRP